MKFTELATAIDNAKTNHTATEAVVTTKQTEYETLAAECAKTLEKKGAEVTAAEQEERKAYSVVESLVNDMKRAMGLVVDPKAQPNADTAALKQIALDGQKLWRK